MGIRRPLLYFLFVAVCSTAMPNHLFKFEENGIWGPQKNTPAMRLVRDISRNYNQHVRPVINDQNTTKVEHLYILHQIVYLDSKEQRLKALYFEVWVWTDEFIRWDPEAYGNITEITLSRDQVWIPDIVVYNELGNNYNYFMKENLIPVNVNNEGSVRCETPLMLETICLLDISDFPFDEQMCKIKVGSWSQPSHKILMSFLLPEGIDTSDYTVNSEWDLRSTSASHILKAYPGTNDTFSELEYSIVLRRRTPFYEKNLIVPTILTSMMSILVFLLPPESGEKISLAITVFLALSLNMLVISDHIPVNSLQVPIISRYSLFSLGTITVSLWSSIMVINIHGFPDPVSATQSKAAPPKIVRFCYKLWPYVSYSRRVNTQRYVQGHNHQLIRGVSPSHGKSSSSDQDSVYCNGRIDILMPERHSVIANNATTTSSSLETGVRLGGTGEAHNGHMPNGQIHQSQSCKKMTSCGQQAHTNTSTALPSSFHNNNNQPSEFTLSNRNDLAVLEQLVNKISDLAVAMSHFVGPDADRNFSSPDNENSDEKTRIKSEWMLVANCLDRIFAIVFFIANITVTFYFFLPYYLS